MNIEEDLLNIINIEKEFPGVRALDNVNISVRRGEIHALCGENGAGKSTLIKIISGIYPYSTYKGQILFDGKEIRAQSVNDVEKLGISTIFQEITLFKKLSIAENLFIGDWPLRNGTVDWDIINRESNEWLERVGLHEDPKTKVENLGIGQQQLVEIAKALRKKLKLLILDEPTSALSDSEVENLFRIIATLKSRKITCIYISHRLEEIIQISDRVTVLRDGQVICTENVKDINKEYLITKMVGRQIKEIYPRIEQKPIDKILELKDWNVFKDKSKKKYIIQGANFQAYRGEILGLAGLMGAGRTELALSLFGLYPDRISGTMTFKGSDILFKDPNEAISSGLAYLSEDRKRFGLVLGMNIASNITLASLESLFKNRILDSKIEKECAINYIRVLQIKATNEKEIVNNLSGGNQQKVAIAKWLQTKPDLLILDEVTRGIDVGAKYEIYKIINKLAQEGMAIIMISSELPELIGVCGRIIVMHEGKIKGEFFGSNISQEEIMTCAMCN